MPKYEFKCARCGEDFEADMKMDEVILPRCPKCKSKVVLKKVSLPASTRVGKYGKGGGN